MNPSQCCEQWERYTAFRWNMVIVFSCVALVAGAIGFYQFWRRRPRTTSATTKK